MYVFEIAEMVITSPMINGDDILELMISEINLTKLISRYH